MDNDKDNLADVDNDDSKNEDIAVIKFKQKKCARKRIKNISLIALIIIVAALSGAASATFVMNIKYSKLLNNSKNKNILQIVDKNKYRNSYGDGEFARAISLVASSVVTISDSQENLTNKKSCVSGFIFKSDGHIITSFSNIKGFKQIFVKLSGIASKPFVGDVLGYDEVSDLAVIKINADNLSTAKLGDKDDTKEGDVVLAIGNSIGNDYIGLATSGIITSTNKVVDIGKTQSTDKRKIKVIQTNAIINEENNGGILISSYGEVLGINSLELSKNYSQTGLNLAVNIEDVSKIVDSIIQFGKVKRLGLGLNGAVVRDAKNTNIKGVYVQSIEPDGSAAKAGIKPTDIIIELNKEKVRSLNDIIKIVDDKKIGDTIDCKILRDGKIVDFKIKLLEDK